MTDYRNLQGWLCQKYSFCRLLLSVVVWAPERLNWSPVLLTGKCEHFATVTSFDLENIELGSPDLQVKKFLYGPTYQRTLVFLSYMGAEIAGGCIICPPPLSRARNFQPLSRERRNSRYTTATTLAYCVTTMLAHVEKPCWNWNIPIRICNTVSYGIIHYCVISNCFVEKAC